MPGLRRCGSPRTLPQPAPSRSPGAPRGGGATAQGAVGLDRAPVNQRPPAGRHVAARPARGRAHAQPRRALKFKPEERLGRWFGRCGERAAAAAAAMDPFTEVSARPEAAAVEGALLRVAVPGGGELSASGGGGRRGPARGAAPRGRVTSLSPVSAPQLQRCSRPGVCGRQASPRRGRGLFLLGPLLNRAAAGLRLLVLQRLPFVCARQIRDSAGAGGRRLLLERR